MESRDDTPFYFVNKKNGSWRGEARDGGDDGGEQALRGEKVNRIMSYGEAVQVYILNSRMREKIQDLLYLSSKLILCSDSFSLPLSDSPQIVSHVLAKGFTKVKL